MTARLISPEFRALDGSGNPISGACLYTYTAGTSTPVTTYSETTLSSANTNPVESGATGLFPDIFIAAGSYKVIFTDGSGSSVGTDVTLDTWDYIEITSSPTLTLTETPNAQTGTSYTIATGDRAKLITVSNASSIALTLPQAESTNFPSGWYTTIHNKGAGTATITPATSTLDGLATYTLRAEEMIRVTSDGTNYQISMVGGQNPGVNAQTGTTYTVVTGDRDKLTTFSNTATVAVVLAQANTTTFKNGWTAEFENIGAGVVTITPTTSTINGGETTLVLTRGQRAKVTSDGTNYQSVTYGVSVGSEMTGSSATPPQGWLVQNGDTMGSAASGATKAAAKYQALYKYIWDSISDTYAAVSSGRGANADADFAANKTIAIPTMANKSAYGVGTAATGETAGATTVASTGSVGTSGGTTISSAEMPAHTHAISAYGISATVFGVAGSGAVTSGNTSVTDSTGGGGSHTHAGGTYTGSASSVLHPIRGKWFYIKY